MRAVALVDVHVDDEHTSDAAGGAELSDRRDDVVEDAEAPSRVREGVVRAATEVHRDPVVEGGMCSSNRRAGGAPRSLDELGRPGQPERELLPPFEAAVADALDPVVG